MTKEITKAFILQEIADKFKLRELEPEIFRFSEMVVPVYDIKPHLQQWEVKQQTISITSATSFSFFVVPQTEIWTLRGYMLVFGMTGAHKASGMYIGRPSAANLIYLDLKKGQDVSYVVNLPFPVIVNPGEPINVLIDDYTSTQNLTVHIDVQVEEIR